MLSFGWKRDGDLPKFSLEEKSAKKCVVVFECEKYLRNKKLCK